jgi:predicted anti-sigma-YlaC factor YlaD
MKCDEIRELMPDLAAGLDASTPETKEHLRSCAECTRTLEEFRRTMALLDEWQVPEPSPYFDTRLKARLREEASKQPAGWMQWFRKPALAISFAVIMLASATVLRLNSPDKPKTLVGNVVPGPGTAVGDLQALDKNHDLYSDFDVLDDLQVQQDVTANP